MKNVVLIYPSCSPGNKPKYGLPPLGILYLATVLKEKGINAVAIDAEILGLNIPNMVNSILKYKPDLVGISVMTPILSTALKIIKKIKETDNTIKTLIGGAHVNSTFEETFKFTNDLDFIIYGEGEYTLPKLVNNLDNEKKYAKIKGLIFKDKNGTIKKNPPREFITDLDILPFPDHDLLDVDVHEYFTPYVDKKPVSAIMTSRGCPYLCTFCDAHTVFGRKVRSRSAKNIVDEIEFLWNKYHYTHIVFKDSTFTLDRQKTVDICKEILDRNIDIQWRCNTRVDRLDPELLRLMKKSGCKSINPGVETGSAKMLKIIKKGLTKEQIMNGFKMIHEAGIESMATFMIGNQGDTKETIMESIDFAIKLDPTFAVFFIATAYPGTELYRWGVEHGKLDPTWYKNAVVKHSESFLIDPIPAGYLKLDFSQEEMKKIAYKKFYFRPHYILKTIKTVIEKPYYIKHIFNSLPFLVKWSIFKKD